MDREKKIRILMDLRSQARDEYLAEVPCIVLEMDKEEEQAIVSVHNINNDC